MRGISSSPRPAPATASNSPRWSAKSWPIWPWTTKRDTTSAGFGWYGFAESHRLLAWTDDRTETIIPAFRANSPESDMTTFKRREFLKASAAFAAASAAGGFGCVEIAKAGPIEAPVVDRLSVRVLVDGAYNLFLRPGEVK